jgi:hypothetical protein
MSWHENNGGISGGEISKMASVMASSESGNNQHQIWRRNVGVCGGINGAE